MWANKEKRSHLRQNLTTKVTEQATESKQQPNIFDLTYQFLLGFMKFSANVGPDSSPHRTRS